MKGLARSYFWWPGLDSQIKNTCRTCEGCALTQSNPPAAPVHRWEFPEKPWYRVHLDFATPFMNSMFLVAVDAHSKWPVVHLMSSTTSSKTIDVLRSIFAIHGLPTQVVSDNGSQTNGLAERFARTMKEALKNDKNNTSLSLPQATAEPASSSDENHHEQILDGPLTVNIPNMEISKELVNSQENGKDEVKSSDDSNTLTQATTIQELPKTSQMVSRPVRNRNPPVWMEDYISK
ncbi:Uncharacterized protein K02A2.6 [Exaiptasia diaphana]|nr:Uncharacterized protein K02A2.6 [Exaiptasia diaphana]